MTTFLAKAGAFAVLAGMFVAWPAAWAEDQPPIGQPLKQKNTNQGQQQQPPPVPEDTNVPPVPDEDGKQEQGVEVQARGPIHEAFAQPSNNGTRPGPGPIVTQQPPEPIQETPPDQRPQGDNVVWIPGYYSYDEEARNFVWVSGCWRVVPEGRKWVPGYWTAVSGGYRWVCGFWAADAEEEAQYVDEPPEAPQEAGPSTPPPDENSTYVPGCWVWRDTRYLWRPGFYLRCRPGFVYCPPRICWTPRGCIFIDAYWDRCLEDRGVLFAPVCFTRPLWRQAGWSFRPTYCVSTTCLVSSLWVRPNWGCYAFGDYYAANYARFGYRPWVTYGPRYRDPLFGYYRWHNRGNPAWQRSLLATYRGRVGGTLPLPARTFAAQQKWLAKARGDRRIDRTTVSSLTTVQSLRSYAASNRSVRFSKVSATEAATRRSTATAYRNASTERHKLETARGAKAGSLPLSRIPGHSPREAVRRSTTPGTVRTPGGPTTTPRPRTGPSSERRTTTPPSVKSGPTTHPRSLDKRPAHPVERRATSTPHPVKSGPSTTARPRSVEKGPARSVERRATPTARPAKSALITTPRPRPVERKAATSLKHDPRPASRPIDRRAATSLKHEPRSVSRPAERRASPPRSAPKMTATSRPKSSTSRAAPRSAPKPAARPASGARSAPRATPAHRPASAPRTTKPHAPKH